MTDKFNKTTKLYDSFNQLPKKKTYVKISRGFYSVCSVFKNELAILGSQTTDLEAGLKEVKDNDINNLNIKENVFSIQYYDEMSCQLTNGIQMKSEKTPQKETYIVAEKVITTDKFEEQLKSFQLKEPPKYTISFAFKQTTRKKYQAQQNKYKKNKAIYNFNKPLLKEAKEQGIKHIAKINEFFFLAVSDNHIVINRDRDIISSPEDREKIATKPKPSANHPSSTSA